MTGGGKSERDGDESQGEPSAVEEKIRINIHEDFGCAPDRLPARNLLFIGGWDVGMLIHWV
jgi:hypothetical protein